MNTHKNINLLKLTFCLVFLLLTPKVKAQSAYENCETAFYQAREAYYNGDFGQVHRNLAYCVQVFEDPNYRPYYYEGEGIVRVYQVYKLSTTAFYQTDEDYRADEMVNRLINYFYPVPAQTIVENLYYTNF